MHQKGHYGAALVVYASVVFILTTLGYTTLGVLDGAVVVGGAMLPDIDQRVPGVKHREPTHTVWFALAVGATVGVVGLLLGTSRGVLAALGTGLVGAMSPVWRLPAGSRSIFNQHTSQEIRSCWLRPCAEKGLRHRRCWAEVYGDRMVHRPRVARRREGVIGGEEPNFRDQG